MATLGELVRKIVTCLMNFWQLVVEKLGGQKVNRLSVNYHFTRQCNYSCGFCFHTALRSQVLPLEEAKRGLKMLSEYGMAKINYSGGEPFLPQRGKYLGELAKYCKESLKTESVTIISNGSLITENWFENYAQYIDILAISCDSFDPETNRLIGRAAPSRNDHIDQLMTIRGWCSDYKVAFKLNTVVNTFNKDEDFTDEIRNLRPIRWKVFQCLLIEGENVGEGALRQAENFTVTSGEFEQFLERHKEVDCLVPESNDMMTASYLILDDCQRFLDNSNGSYEASKSILDVGVEEALKFSGFDEQKFLKRGGKYKWSKKDLTEDALEW